MKIRVIWPGKTKAAFYRQAVEEYASRIRKLTSFEIIETREESATDKSRIRRIQKESAALFQRRRASVTVVLDSAGKQLTSEQFAEWLRDSRSDVDFLLGGPAGLKVSEATMTWSLGSITLPHELARVVLLEQIYRALTILKRLPYHK